MFKGLAAWLVGQCTQFDVVMYKTATFALHYKVGVRLHTYGW
jgi:hypothetical protein